MVSQCSAGLVFNAIIFAVFAVLFGLAFDYIVSKNYKESVVGQKDPKWWSGGTWGPGSGYSRSSGSFGGGRGGSSGGGGSSGSW